MEEIQQRRAQERRGSTGASRSVWDDEPPTAMEVSDAPVAETIQQLVAAGIDSVVDHEWASSPGASLPEEATPHTDVTARPRSVFRSRRRRSRRPAATTDPYFTLDFDSETMASEVLTVHETPEPSSVDMAEATQEEERPKLKRAKNKISPPTDSPAHKSKYAHLMVDSDEEETPEEQVDIGFISMLHERHPAR